MSPYFGNGSDGKRYWLTPPDLYASLDAEFGFDFDPCPYPKPEWFDGLTLPWGQSNYVNPPFKGPTRWVRKAIYENSLGKRVVFVFPIDKWVLYLLEAGAKVRNLRDVRWHSIEDGQPGKGTGRHIAPGAGHNRGEVIPMFEMLALLAALSCGSGCTTEATVQTTTTEDQVTDNMPTYVGPTKKTPKEENPHDGCKYCQ